MATTGDDRATGEGRAGAEPGMTPVWRRGEGPGLRSEVVGYLPVAPGAGIGRAIPFAKHQEPGVPYRGPLLLRPHVGYGFTGKQRSGFDLADVPGGLDELRTVRGFVEVTATEAKAPAGTPSVVGYGGEDQAAEVRSNEARVGFSLRDAYGDPAVRPADEAAVTTPTRRSGVPMYRVDGPPPIFLCNDLRPGEVPIAATVDAEGLAAVRLADLTLVDEMSALLSWPVAPGKAAWAKAGSMLAIKLGREPSGLVEVDLVTTVGLDADRAWLPPPDPDEKPGLVLTAGRGPIQAPPSLDERARRLAAAVDALRGELRRAFEGVTAALDGIRRELRRPNDRP